MIDNKYVHLLKPHLIDGKTAAWKEWKTHRKARRSLGDMNGRLASKVVEVDFSKFTPDNYLFSWATAVAGVEPEEDGHTIVTPHNKWINDNGNAWLNEVILEAHNTFIMAENYLEHIQIPELSKGKILDAVAWVVHQQVGGYPEPIPTIFVDILVATNKKKHPKLCQNLVNGTIDSMSMGCDILWSQCSKCGKFFKEGEDDPCNHIKEQLGRSYTDRKGRKRRVAELCGKPGQPGSCVFKECSWVRKAAFVWAKRHGFLDVTQETTGKPLRAFVPEERIKEAAKE
jgi:hypothetical protein